MHPCCTPVTMLKKLVVPVSVFIKLQMRDHEKIDVLMWDVIRHIPEDHRTYTRGPQDMYQRARGHIPEGQRTYTRRPQDIPEDIYQRARRYIPEGHRTYIRGYIPEDIYDQRTIGHIPETTGHILEDQKIYTRGSYDIALKHTRGPRGIILKCGVISKAVYCPNTLQNSQRLGDVAILTEPRKHQKDPWKTVIS